ncbi:hypothetical protein C8J56DRAFT_1173071 [Mycena floridula]|nr:hypothetical protein C8J56DRAFT_1173071 [Mycena floridula]
MQFAKLVSLLPVFFAFTHATPTPAESIILNRAVTSLNPQCNVAMTLSPAGWSIFYQDQTGGINVLNLGGLFDGGQITSGPTQIVSPGEVLPCTPLAAIPRNSNNQAHVFFLSPNLIVSEYFFAEGQANLGWQGGSGCTSCLTSSNFKVASGTRALFAATNTANEAMAVGFISDSNPGTLTQAVKRAAGWVLATLPS